MGLRRHKPGSTHGRHHLGTPPYIEIQKQFGKALRKQYEPPPELPHHLLTLLIQLSDKDNE
jgi:hypothetical protein